MIYIRCDVSLNISRLYLVCSLKVNIFVNILLLLPCHYWTSAYTIWFKGSGREIDSMENFAQRNLFISHRSKADGSITVLKHNKMKSSCFHVFTWLYTDSFVFVHVLIYSALMWRQLHFLHRLFSWGWSVCCQPGAKAMTKTSFQPTTCPCGLVPFHTTSCLQEGHVSWVTGIWGRSGLDFSYSQ